VNGFAFLGRHKGKSQISTAFAHPVVVFVVVSTSVIVRHCYVLGFQFFPFCITWRQIGKINRAFIRLEISMNHRLERLPDIKFGCGNYKPIGGRSFCQLVQTLILHGLDRFYIIARYPSYIKTRIRVRVRVKQGPFFAARFSNRWNSLEPIGFV
jgi:hypothetical protein